MKICWDNLESVWLSKDGNLKIGTNTYVEMYLCGVCGVNYLTLKSRLSKFCSLSCAVSGENNPNYGKHRTTETRKKISESMPDRAGVLSYNYKGGIIRSGLTIYDTYKDRLEPYEDIRKQIDTEILEAKCAYCGQWFSPAGKAVNGRLEAINTLNNGECRLYCSENCKQSCPTYGQRKYPKGFKKATSREVSTYLRQMVFERDNWECQKCGKTIKEVALHCHHIKGYAQNKVLANDADNCITLCKDCHKEIHKQKDCRYVDLQCEKNKEEVVVWRLI